ncbi:YpsA SLOG family protein [Wolinella succinogenes]
MTQKTVRVILWAKEHSIHVLNIARPRESEYQGLHDTSLAFLRRLLKET